MPFNGYAECDIRLIKTAKVIHYAKLWCYPTIYLQGILQSLSTSTSRTLTPAAVIILPRPLTSIWVSIRSLVRADAELGLAETCNEAYCLRPQQMKDKDVLIRQMPS